MTQRLCIFRREILLLVFLSLALASKAIEIEQDGIAYSIDLSQENPSATVIQREKGYSGHIIVPKQIDYKGLNYPVTKVGDAAFNSSKNLFSVTLPESVTYIDSHSFDSCPALIEIILPVGLTRIEEKVFWGCSSLTSIIIPQNVEFIGYLSFVDCTSLTSIILPEGLKEIDDGAFLNCSKLENINLPKKIDYLGMSAFEDCLKLDNLVIPDGITRIYKSTFSSCQNLSSVIIPRGITRIDEKAFYQCSSLQSVVLSENLQSIGTEVFGECPNLTSVTVRSSIPLSITDDVFYNYDATLYVPIGSSEAYKADAIWGKFTKIEEYNPSSLAEVVSDSSSDGITLSLPSPGTLSIVSAKSQSITLCNASGTLLRMISLEEGENLITDLVPGLYLVGGQKVVVQ